MIRVLHLLDDANLGGIQRLLDLHGDGLGPGLQVERRIIDSAAAPPADLDADVAVVHFTLAWRKLPFLMRLRRRLRGRRLVIVEHSYTAAFEARCVPRRARFRLMLRLGMAMADTVVAVSEGQAAWLRQARIVPARKLRVICPASEIDACTHVPPIEPHAGPLRLGSYGRYAPQKGLARLLEAFRSLPPGLATLTLAGYGEEEAALRGLAADLPNVEIRGPVADPATFLAEMDAILMPSLWEAYGLVCVEARAAGRPVLVSDLDGLSEQVPPALRIPQAGAGALAERIRWLAAQDLRALGESLRAGAAGSVERHRASWGALLREARAHA